MTSTPPSSELPRRFRGERLLRDGNGVRTWLAFDEESGARVVVKTARAANALAHRRLEREVEQRRRLHGPSSTAVVATGEVARALAFEPTERHRSMRELTAALDRVAHRGRRWAGIAIATAVAVVTAIAFALPGEAATDPCANAGAEIDGIWNAARAERVRAAFAATDRPSAADASKLVSRGFDAWRATYRSMERDRCVATQQRTQPDALLARRAACLHRRRSEGAALLELLFAADAKTIDRAKDAVETLEGIESCGDFAALAQDVPLPSAAQESAVAAVREQLARAVAFGVVGQAKAGLEVAGRAFEAAQTSGHAPTVAEVRFELGRLRSSAGDNEDAEADQRAATFAALAVRDDQLATKAALQVAHLVGNQGSRFGEAHWALELARTLIARMGGDASLEATLNNTRGAVAYKQGHFREAVEAYRRGIELRKRAGAARWIPGPQAAHFAEATIRMNLANALAAAGDFEDALAEHQRALAARLANEGPSHPGVASSYNNIGFTYMEVYRYRDALPWFERGLALRERLLAPEHWLIGTSHANIGMALAGLGQYERALDELVRGRTAIEKKLGRGHVDVAAIETEIAAVHLAQGRLDVAEEDLRRAFAAVDASVGRDHAQVARTHEVHGQLLSALGRDVDAWIAFATALSITSTARPGSPALVGPLVGLGRVALALGDVDEAIAALDEALARSRYADPTVEGDGAFALARALELTVAPAATVTGLVGLARRAFLDAGASERLAEVDRWQADRAR